MPTITFTDRAIAGLKPKRTRVEYFDRSFPGFGIRVTPAGAKSFVLLYRPEGQATIRRLTLGAYGIHPPDLTLAKARENARNELQKVTIGRDPAAERQVARTQTFSALCDLYIEKHAKRRKRSWRDDARMIRQELDGWAHRPAASVRRKDVRDLLDAIVDRGAPVAANRTLALVRKIFNFAVDQEWVDVNPAHRMPRPSVEQSRTRVLTPDELRSVWTWLERPAPDDLDAVDRRHFTLNQAALKLRLITAQRGGEVISMRWADVDLTTGWWVIHSEHAKNKLPHRVPLTKTAIKTIEALRKQAPDDAVDVFTGIKGTRHRRGVLDGLEVPDLRPHDFRRTAASLMTGAGISRLVVGKVLNHVEVGVTSIYDRHGYDSEKRIAMETWERTLLGIIAPKRGTVRPFTKRA
jgi:integrase